MSENGIGSKPCRLARREKFCQNIVKGMAGSDALRDAGYAANNKNISHYMNVPEIRERIKYLQKQASDESVATLKECLEELSAQIRGEFSSTIKRLAIETLARLCGWQSNDLNVNIKNVQELSDEELMAIIKNKEKDDEA